ECVVVGAALLLDPPHRVERLGGFAAAWEAMREIAEEPQRAGVVVLVPPPARDLGERARAVRSGLARRECPPQGFRRFAGSEIARRAGLDPERVIAGFSARRAVEDQECFSLGTPRVPFDESELRLRQALGGARFRVRVTADAFDQSPRTIDRE